MWTVVRCPDCKRCRGIRKNPGSCGFCGSRSVDVQIIGEAADAGELQSMVASANLPEELRNQVDVSLKSSVLDRDFNPKSILNALQKAAGDNCVISIPVLEVELAKVGIQVTVEQVLQEATHQGILMQTADREHILLD